MLLVRGKFAVALVARPSAARTFCRCGTVFLFLWGIIKLQNKTIFNEVRLIKGTYCSR